MPQGRILVRATYCTELSGLRPAEATAGAHQHHSTVVLARRRQRMIDNPVHWFEIYVQDMERAKWFYQSVVRAKLKI